jgi:hypothetical protein
MKTDAIGACGVWIEFLDERGNTVAQHVVDEWHGRPVPERGDHVDFADIVGVRKHRGTVIGRRFDMQQSVDGEPQLWVGLVVRVDADVALPVRARNGASFSVN